MMARDTARALADDCRRAGLDPRVICTGQGERARCFVSVSLGPAGPPVDLREPDDFARLLAYLKTTIASEEP
jgi:hypothetical protein